MDFFCAKKVSQGAYVCVSAISILWSCMSLFPSVCAVCSKVFVTQDHSNALSFNSKLLLCLPETLKITWSYQLPQLYLISLYKMHTGASENHNTGTSLNTSTMQ